MKAAVVHCLHTGMRRESGDISGDQRVSWTMSQQHVPVYGRGGVRASIVADPEASPVQLHGNVIIVPFIQQHSAVFISGNLRPQRASRSDLPQDEEQETPEATLLPGD